MADNVQTAAQWGQVIENLDLMKKSALTQATETQGVIADLTSQRLTLSSQLEAADRAGDTALMSVIQNRINNTNQRIEGANLALANIQRDIADYDQSLNNAFAQQSTAESGPPNLNSTVQPASDQPGNPTDVYAPEPLTEINLQSTAASPEDDPDLPQPDLIDVEPPTLTAEDVGEMDAGVQAQLEFEQEQNRALLEAENYQPEPVNLDDDPNVRALDEASRADAEERFNEQEDPDSAFNAQTRAYLQQAKDQATIQQRYGQTAKGDWRVRLRLGPGATYLYKDTSNALLAPLRVSDGVIFPYTPTVNTNYQAKYDPYDLVHSNYRGYFYKSSAVSDINIQAQFTAQDTKEAQYLLAVIHFFRSVTKMFYGKDAERGTPPPLVYLSGYGEFQFNGHACLVSNFQYSLPNDVDYISVTPNNQGLSMAPRNNLTSSSPLSGIDAVLKRLQSIGVPKGAAGGPTDLGVTSSTVSGTGQSTYVPTKIDMQITLLPVQTRSQVSQQFSAKNFANGNLLRGGFW